MSTLHCNFLWAVRKQRQSGISLWKKKKSLEDIHCLTDMLLYNIPVKAPSTTNNSNKNNKILKVTFQPKHHWQLKS